MIAILLMFIIATLLISLYLRRFKSVFFSPSFVAISTILIGIFFYMFSIEKWDSHLTLLTIVVLVVGCFLIFLADILASNSVKSRVSAFSEIKEIVVERFKIIILLVTAFLFFILYALSVYKIGHANGLNFAEAIVFVKENYGSGVSINVIVRQSYKFILALGYIGGFIFTNNVLILHKKVKRNIPYLVFILLSFAINLITGSRGDIFRVLTAILLFYLVLFYKKNHSFKYLFKNMKKIIIICFFMIVVIFAARFIVKSDNVESSNLNFFAYLSYYIGSPIEVLNIKIRNGLEIYKTNMIGGNIFNYFYSDLSRLLNFDFVINPNDQVYLGSLAYGGNVGTIFLAPLIDFGIIGGLIFIFFLFLIFDIIFYKVIKTFFRKQNALMLIIFGYIYSIFTFAFYDLILTQYISDTGIITLACIVMLSFFIFAFPLKTIKVGKNVNENIV